MGSELWVYIGDDALGQTSAGALSNLPVLHVSVVVHAHLNRRACLTHISI